MLSSYLLKRITFFELLLAVLTILQFVHITILFMHQNFPIPLLCGPLFWLMYSELGQKDRRWMIKRFVAALIPFLFFAVWRLCISDQFIWDYMRYYIPTMILSQVTYISFIFVRLGKQKLNEEMRVLLKQVMLFSLGITVFAAILFIKNYGRIDLTLDINPLHTIAIATGFSSFFICCYLRSFYRSDENQEIPVLLQGPEVKNDSRRIGKFNDDLMSLLQTVENKKLYLDPRLTLEKLANYTGLDKSSISNFLHEELGYGYYEWLASYRIKYAQRILQESGEEYKLEAIAHASGFLSKTTFNRYFKDIVGVKPSVYREKLALV